MLSSLWSWLEGGSPPPPFQSAQSVSKRPAGAHCSGTAPFLCGREQPVPLKQLKVNHPQQLPLLFILQHKSVGKGETAGPNSATEKTLNWELQLNVRGLCWMLEEPIWWCHLRLLLLDLVLEAPPRGGSALPGTLYWELQLIVLKGLPELVSAGCMEHPIRWCFIVVCLSVRLSLAIYVFFLFILLWLDIYLVNSLIQNPEHGCHRSFCGWRRAWYREGSTLRVHRGSTPHTCPTHFFICHVLLSLGVPFANNWQACLLNSVRHSEELNTRRRLWESGHSWWWVGGSGS